MGPSTGRSDVAGQPLVTPPIRGRAVEGDRRVADGAGAGAHNAFAKLGINSRAQLSKLMQGTDRPTK